MCNVRLSSSSLEERSVGKAKPRRYHSGSGRNPEKSGSSEGSKMKIHDVFRTLPRKRTIYSVAIFANFLATW